MAETSAWALCNREARRRRLTEAHQASVEFDVVGGRFKQSVQEISETGFSFVLGEAGPKLELDSEVSDVCLRVGESELRGDIKVVHLTTTSENATVCGVAFQPESAAERARLEQVLARIDADVISSTLPR